MFTHFEEHIRNFAVDKTKITGIKRNCGRTH